MESNRRDSTKILWMFVLFLFAAGCGKGSDSDVISNLPQPTPTPAKNVEKHVVQYPEGSLQFVRTGEKYQSGMNFAFETGPSTKVLRVLYNFRARQSNALKIVQFVDKSVCASKDDRANFEFFLRTADAVQPVAISELLMLKENDDYTLEVEASGKQCSSINFELVVWSDKAEASAQPQLARRCGFNADTALDIFYGEQPLSVFSTSNKQKYINGFTTFCGKHIDGTYLGITQDHFWKSSTEFWRMEVDFTRGARYGYSANLNHEDGSGEIRCLKNGLEFEAQTFVGCEKFILNRSLYPD